MIKNILSTKLAYRMIMLCWGSALLLTVGIMIVKIGEQIFKWGI